MNCTLPDLLAAVPELAPIRQRAIHEKLLQNPLLALRYDSRMATAGTVFFCLVGKTSDGHLYAPSAYRNGCRIFAVERELDLPKDALQLLVPDTRKALADCSAVFYDHPERHMRLIGLTGTKGKTTTSLLIRTLLEEAGIPAGYIGTNGVDYRNYHFQTVNSTPESAEIYRYLRSMLDEGVAVCVLEVSSQALWMERTRGLCFDTVLFTNLSRDHIGGVEHPDWEHYRDCKRRLFTDYPAEAVAVNHDDPNSAYMVDQTTAPLLEFGLTSSEEKPLWYACDLRPMRQADRLGVGFAVYRGGVPLGNDWFLPLPGHFNVQNALAALTVVCERFGVDVAMAKKILAHATVQGRFEAFSSPALPNVSFIIDYAHNGVSLASILDALKIYEPQRLIWRFGSVGGRTTERRRDLAEAAGPRCDLCILTSDNPACEPPEAIIDEIDAAFPEGSCPRIKITDRASAIRHVVEIAQEGDVILLAGKGHENYQLVGTVKEPFSEIDVLRDALADLERADSDIPENVEWAFDYDC